MSRAVLMALAVMASANPASAFFSPMLPCATPRVAQVNAVSSIDMMRHGCRVARLGLPADQRKALLRSLTTELIRHGRITTTLKRAKAMRDPVSEARRRWGPRHALKHLFPPMPSTYQAHAARACRLI